MNKKEFKLNIDAVWIVVLMIIIYTVVLSYYTILKHITFETNAYDLGIFLNSFWNTIHEGRFFYTTLWEGSRFENHFSPFLFLLLPIYKLLPSTDALAEFLLSFQSFILALGALPIYWIAKKEINKTSGLIFALLYLTYPALQGINRFDFHEAAIAPTMILFAYYYFREKKYNMSGLFIMLSLISREDVAMVIIPMAMIWLWDVKQKSLRDRETIFCVATIFISWIWFLIATQVIIPIYSPEGYWFIIEYKVSYLLIDINKKLLFLVSMFLPLLFTSLFNKIILVTGPIYARILFSNRPQRYNISNQHTSLLVPFMFISSIYVVKYLVENEHVKKICSIKMVYPIIVAYLTMSFFMSPILADVLQHNTIPQLQVVPDGGPVAQNRLLTVTPHFKALGEVIDMIPYNASVYTQNNIFPHMADRPNVYYVLGDDQIFRGWNNQQIAKIVPWKEGNFEYVLVDDSKYNRNWGTLKNLDVESLKILQQNYGVYLATDQIYLFKRGYNGTTTLPTVLLENYDNGYINGYYNGVLVSYYNNNNLSGLPVLTDRVENINFKWNKLSPIPGVINRGDFSVKFDGYVYAPQNGYYSLQLVTDGGARLFVDDQLIIDAWITKHFVEEPYQISLTKGLHKVHIDYRERKDSTYIYLNWFTPWKGLFEPIPEEYFYIPKDVNSFMANNSAMYVINNTVNNNTNKTGNSNIVVLNRQ